MSVLRSGHAEQAWAMLIGLWERRVVPEKPGGHQESLLLTLGLPGLAELSPYLR